MISAQILDGKTLSQQILYELHQEVQQLLLKGKRTPGIAVIQVGQDPASTIYVKNKHLACQTVGIYSEPYALPENISEDALLELIAHLNDAPNIDGILVQLPLPKQMNSNKIIEKILPEKDVDGFHPYNIGRLAQKNPLLSPCTPLGVMALLEHYQIPIQGQHAVIVGASNIVGRPMALEMLQAGATITVCHRQTQQLSDMIYSADILISATGNPSLIQTEWIKPKSIVVDIGITRTPEGKIRGDIDFDAASKIARWITPVPGGVGPMTVAMLMKNNCLMPHLLKKKTSNLSLKRRRRLVY
jgi:methylenetetrahydrofolate dehydrogenase (NADP+) / methenyltetrahydrofolate cyclohydrolase